MVSRKRASTTPKKDPKRAKRVASVKTDGTIVEVVSSRKIGGILHYLVKWADGKKSSWESHADVKRAARSLVDEYEKKQAEDDDREYEVEKLVDKKTIKGKVQYCVKWVNFGSSENTWESSDDLPKDKVTSFEKEFGKPAKQPPKQEKPKPNVAKSETKKGGKQKKAPPTPKKTPKKEVVEPVIDRIANVLSRKIVNNVVHYEVKFVGKAGKKTLPIFEIDDFPKIQEYESENRQEGVGEVDQEALDESAEYVVEKIIAKRGTGRSLAYRVKWLGFGSSNNTWEPVENLDGSQKLIREFEKTAEEKEKKIAETDYDVEKILGEKLWRKKLFYLVKWRGYSRDSSTYEPAESLGENCQDKILEWHALQKKKEEQAVVNAAKRAEKSAARKAKREVEKQKKKEEKDTKSAENEETTETTTNGESTEKEAENVEEGGDANEE